MINLRVITKEYFDSFNIANGDYTIISLSQEQITDLSNKPQFDVEYIMFNGIPACFIWLVSRIAIPNKFIDRIDLDQFRQEKFNIDVSNWSFDILNNKSTKYTLNEYTREVDSHVLIAKKLIEEYITKEKAEDRKLDCCLQDNLTGECIKFSIYIAKDDEFGNYGTKVLICFPEKTQVPVDLYQCYQKECHIKYILNKLYDE